MTEIGKGSRRVCLRLPDAPLCVKRYRDDGEVGETVRKEIERCKFDRRRNTCAQEYDYIRSISARIPPEVFAVFPETMELKEDPVHGWHLVESLVLNGDGSTGADNDLHVFVCGVSAADVEKFIVAKLHFNATVVKVHVLDSIPLNANGKTDYPKLKGMCGK